MDNLCVKITNLFETIVKTNTRALDLKANDTEKNKLEN